MYLLLIVALIFSLLKSVKFRPTPKTILAGLIGVAIFIGYYYYRSFYIYTGWPIIAQSTLFTGVPYSLHDHWNKFNNMIKSSINPQLPTGIKIIPPAIRDTDKPIIGVIVIGESASRNYMNLYGYSRDTTPMLNKIKNELLIYNDLCGSEPITCLALHKLFSQATVAHPNNFQCTYWDVLKHAGFKIIYISSQEKWGTKAGDINDPRQLEQSILFKAVDKAIYSKDYDPQSYNTKFDKALLPIFIEELRKNAHHNTIICVHLLGSHFPQEKFCPSDFGKISENLVDAETQGLTPGMRKRRNYYDNSIAFTDEVLNELLVELKKIDATTFALYISDHGETPQSAVWRDNDDIDLWELPLIIWLSNKYQWAYPEFRKGARKNLNQPMQSEFLFWSLLALAQVTTDNFPETKNIFSEKYIPPKERFIQNGKVKYVPNKQR